jgi:hypothetical protein
VNPIGEAWIFSLIKDSLQVELGDGKEVTGQPGDIPGTRHSGPEWSAEGLKQFLSLG